ncbi:hypothetical protein MJO28_012029 [Puccinia striiformis f. sp. tritici]|uniref:Secreted protein n=2 Tax=Puccinia striiformis TaxID=27350 RepID=A0A2S4VDP5_9BASI|nr:hypothetical protein Pst134EA_023131 [Puccinia striiformis f. sp. tritici]KAH9455673.1 hypothetical protein Pst134EA_023131 [Puccinia striiformis f. sp. tritici]KAI7942002.1 hypothetical protein MJO28_012029 [Puccinia striiformis f. sp. tritici]KAI9623677.1 hypothetical protein H4Q26_014404 [Puccinia striiformis f. sp. tritici PST-130]POW07617.1 hypothetical protein PSHT_09900 [Puccinia striiformis]
MRQCLLLFVCGLVGFAHASPAFPASEQARTGRQLARPETDASRLIGRLPDQSPPPPDNRNVGIHTAAEVSTESLSTSLSSRIDEGSSVASTIGQVGIRNRRPASRHAGS